MIVLGIDTSTAASSVALVHGDEVLAREIHVDARGHAEVLAPLVERVLRVAGVRPDLVAVGVGPGPYTGLRVGVTTARTLGLAWNVPVVGVCSLDALAVQGRGNGEFVVATDARRKEVYWARYDTDGHRLDGPFVGRAADTPEHIHSLPWLTDPALSPPAPSPSLGAPAHASLVGLPPTSASSLSLSAAAESQHSTSPAPAHASLVAPDATDVARLAAAWVQAGTQPAAPPAHWSEHGTDDGSTARSLAGLTLLQPYPLYVRRADAAAPSTMLPKATP